jgi:Xaa-Pro aminopeptidase
MNAPVKASSKIPFDAARLDKLMDEAGMDVLIATSKHNVQYLLGGHRAFFFEYMDAMGLSRYLPVLVYAKGAPDKAAYFGHRLENFQRDNNPFWTPVQQCNNSGSLDTMQKAIEHIRSAGIKTRGIGAELSFLPVDAGKALSGAFADSKMSDALFVLERMRAIKTPEELRKLKIASEAVIESMLAVIAKHGPGSTKAEVTEALRREETNRGLTFEYCLITAGASLNRAPSDQVWGKGDIMSIDSGGNYHGYIGDLCRMAIQGEPDAELEDMLADIEEIQRASMKPIKAGAMGTEVYAAGEGRLAKSKYHNNMHFLGHGMGLVSHEAPRLTKTGPVPYDDYDAHRPLEAGMVISVETTLAHPKRGFIKLEDTAVVTDKGCDIYGEGARGWNRAGTAA